MTLILDIFVWEKWIEVKLNSQRVIVRLVKTFIENRTKENSSSLKKSFFSNLRMHHNSFCFRSLFSLKTGKEWEKGGETPRKGEKKNLRTEGNFFLPRFFSNLFNYVWRWRSRYGSIHHCSVPSPAILFLLVFCSRLSICLFRSRSKSIIVNNVKTN